MVSKNPKKIQALFNSISKNYDKMNDIMSFGLHRSIKKNIVSNLDLLPKKSKVIDLCTGTGDLAKLLYDKEFEVTAVDFSSEMIKIARKKNPKVKFIEADCTNLPFEDETFDACIISFGLRNIENMEKALKEIHRILKKDGIFINLDLGKPKNILSPILFVYMNFWIAFLGKIFNKNDTPYKYFAQSNKNFPNPENLIKIFEEIGFQFIKRKDYVFGQLSMQMNKKL